MEKYFNGTELYGNDFTIEQIMQWYEEEKEGYARLKEEGIYKYPYDSMNRYFGFKYLNKKKFNNVLGIGSAYGHEFLPIISMIDNITILEPSDNLISDKLGNVIPKYLKPEIDGTISFEDKSFDLITCFGVLHHIPNVSYVLSEMLRVLEPGGIMLIREPIRSMGDWRTQRKGLTKNERGIPLSFFQSFFRKQKNVTVVKKTIMDSAFMFKILKKLFKGINKDSIPYQKLDKWVSAFLQWNIKYHPKNIFQKCAPATVYYVLTKNET